MNKFIKGVSASLVGLSLLAGCSTQAPGTNSSSPAPAKDHQITVGLALSTENNPFFVSLKDGAEKAANENHMKLITVDAQDDPAKQTSGIEDLIQKKVDVLLVNPTDSSAIKTAIQSANQANIPVITVDRTADGGKVVSHVASNNIEGGQMAAKYILNKLGNKGNIVELQGIPGSSAARERGKGFHEMVDKAAGVKVVASQPADFDRAKGLTVMENILQSNKNVNAVFAQNDEMALGAIKAIQAAGLKNVVIVGFDGTADGVKAVKEGKMSATIAQQPELIGKYAIDAASKVVKGESVDKTIPVQLQLIEK
ncbi:ribose ABC transporter substrate-binding protein RbsB [Aneurinibacillus terranovensis]|uniref:ribose ABC transporter substrate-binding protein RbsB n=1 Tax=Aneurinibacillus terranovensis TaxID=278991 RepID=UPI00042508E3|nr:ribose ABC transporter substrate-binding protein RbsB [Aneurinibacillus terranovensis]